MWFTPFRSVLLIKLLLLRHQLHVTMWKQYDVLRSGHSIDQSVNSPIKLPARMIRLAKLIRSPACRQRYFLHSLHCFKIQWRSGVIVIFYWSLELYVSCLMSCDNGCFVLQQEDEKKNKKRQSPVDERPVVPAPSEAMLNSKFKDIIA